MVFAAPALAVAGLAKAAAAGFFSRALIDLDGAFEVGAVFDHDARGGQIADHRAIFLDLDAVLGAKIFPSRCRRPLLRGQ